MWGSSEQIRCRGEEERANVHESDPQGHSVVDAIIVTNVEAHIHGQKEVDCELHSTKGSNAELHSQLVISHTYSFALLQSSFQRLLSSQSCPSPSFCHTVPVCLPMSVAVYFAYHVVSVLFGNDFGRFNSRVSRSLSAEELQQQ